MKDIGVLTCFLFGCFFARAFSVVGMSFAPIVCSESSFALANKQRMWSQAQEAFLEWQRECVNLQECFAIWHDASCEQTASCSGGKVVAAALLQPCWERATDCEATDEACMY